MSKQNFIKRLQSTPKIKAIKKKIRKNNLVAKRLSKKYRQLIKSESKRLSR